MATQEQNDRNKRLHTQLLQKLSAEMTDDDVIKFKQFCQNEGLGRGELEKMKNASDVFLTLYDMGKFKVGEYSKLKAMLGDFETGLGMPQRFGDIIDYWQGKMVLPNETGDSTDGQGTSNNYSSPSPKKRKRNPGSQSDVTDNDDQAETDCYPRTRPDGKGYLVIFNNFTEDRKGTKTDVQSLEKFFKVTLKYDVKVYDNVGKETMLKKLEGIRCFLDNDLNSLDSVVIAVLSHGSKEGIKTCKDGKTWDKKYVTQEELTGPFKGDQLKPFIGKPKMFLIQACRGDERQLGYTRSDDKPEDKTPPPTRIVEDYLHIESPKEADMLIYSSTTDGHLSYRDERDGTWCVRHLVDVLEENHKTKDLLSMLTMVNDKVADEPHPFGFKQMPCIYSTLRKKIKL